MKRLFVDIETSPNKGYVWRAGYKQHVGWEWIIDERQIISAAWAWNSSKVEAKGWDWGKGTKGDYSLVKRLVDLSHDADEVVAHHGDGFDVPWIRTRAVFHRITMPDVVTIDTCKLARNKFYFNSNCLDYLGKLLFNKQKIKTDYTLWIDVMNGEQKALAKMIRYNKRDVVLLREAYKRLEPFCKAGSHAGVADGRPRWSCPSCGSLGVKIDKRRATSVGIVRWQMYCNRCHKFYTIANNVKLQYEERQK